MTFRVRFGRGFRLRYRAAIGAAGHVYDEASLGRLALADGEHASRRQLLCGQYLHAWQRHLARDRFEVEGREFQLALFKIVLAVVHLGEMALVREAHYLAQARLVYIAFEVVAGRGEYFAAALYLSHYEAGVRHAVERTAVVAAQFYAQFAAVYQLQRQFVHAEIAARRARRAVYQQFVVKVHAVARRAGYAQLGHVLPRGQAAFEHRAYVHYI